MSFSKLLLNIFFLFIITAAQSTKPSDNGFIREDDLCLPINRHRVYIELNERAKLLVQDLPDPALFNGTGRCMLEIVTCPSCVVEVRMLAMSNSAMCREARLSVSEGTDVTSNGVLWCNQMRAHEESLAYRSQARTLIISLTYTMLLPGKIFVLEYTALRNRIEIFAEHIGQTGFISSPLFPKAYPRDLSTEWMFICRLLRDCRVQIIFRDFQLETATILEILDSYGQRLDVFGGEVYRPPVLLSTGPGLQIRFYANGASGKGFVAEYSFITSSPGTETLSDCGGLVDNMGGAITMMDMVPVNSSSRHFDCLWLIRPIRSYNHPKTHIFLKVATFREMLSPSQVQVIEGLDSTGPLLETVRGNSLQREDHVVPAHIGLYVRLQGTFSRNSRLAIVYAAFSYANCFAGAEFPCHNQRCIAAHLICDGFDQCGDGSDEPDSCPRDWPNSRHESRWHSITPNYYFPKIERYPDLKTAALAFLAASLGLLLVISALLVLLYRLGARSRHQRQLHTQLQTISELLENARAEESPTQNGAASSTIVEQPPPTYEPPPEYDQVIKVDIPFADESNQQNANRTRRTRRTRRAPRPPPLSSSEVTSNPVPRSPPPSYTPASMPTSDLLV